ncbi:hypothetical protein V1522DRAFT_391937 [Lipomyces starkeyi]
MAIGDNEQVSYQLALKFLTANEPEKRLDIRPLALYGDAKYMSKYQKNAVVVVCHWHKGHCLHGPNSAALLFSSQLTTGHHLCRIQRTFFVQHQKQELFERIAAGGGSTYSSVNEQGRRSTKTPDAGIIYYYDGGGALTIIEEVGVSEWYPQLIADIMLWMNEFHCRTAILLYNKVSPRFGSREYRRIFDQERPAFVQAMKQVG